VIATARRPEALSTFGDECISTVLLDVTDSGSIDSARKKVADLTRGTGLDILVNNA